MFPDVELALCEYLEDIAPTYTATGETLDTPVIAIARVGGGLDRQGLFDTATVEIQCFGNTRPESIQLNAAVRARLSYVRGLATEQGLIDKITESTAPVQIPYADEDIRRVTSMWTVTTRSIS